jgi:hypothetical protein
VEWGKGENEDEGRSERTDASATPAAPSSGK